jgi:hypothetical protein
MNLYEINKAYQDVLENGFSFDDETGEILFDSESLDLLEDEFKNKIDNIVSYIKNQEALKDGISNEIKALNERKKDVDKKIEYLKGYITDSMHIRGLKKMETPRNKISFRLSQSVDVKNENLIDGQYFIEKVERKIDKKTLLADLKKGIHVEGAELLKKQNLQIK